MKKIILATSNRGKVKEFREYLTDFEIITYTSLLEPFEIIENGNTFKENAIIKAKAVFEKLNSNEYIVIADDSGITIPCLNYEPSIHSARYAGENATSEENLKKLIFNLKKRGCKRAEAFYTASLAIATDRGVWTTHGWMYGSVIDEAKGNNGFGYDPIFIPKGYNKTLGELSSDIKRELSHRSKAIELAKILLK